MAQTNSLDLERGSSQYATIAYASASTALRNLGNTYTLEAWIRLESLPSSGQGYGIWTHFNNTDEGQPDFFYCNEGGTLRFQVYVNGATGRYDVALTAGIWYHIAFTYNSGTSLYYLNGRQVSASGNPGAPTASLDAIHVGYGGFALASGGYFDGLLKDVRVFDDVRTQAEIISDAWTQNVSNGNLVGEWNFNNAYTDSSGGGNTLSGVNTPTFPTTIPWTAPASGATSQFTTPMVSWWTMNEASGNRSDSKGSNTLTDNNTVGSATGKWGLAADFEASNSESLSISDGTQSGLDFTGDVSIAGWVNIESAPSGKYGLVTKQASSNESYQLNYREDSGKKLQFQNTSGGTGATENIFTFSSDLGTATWHHIVMSFDASAATVEMFVDGISVGRVTSTNTSIFNGNATFYVGAGNAADFFDGLIDELSVYNTALDYGNVLDLYAAGAGIPYASASFTPTPMMHMMGITGGLI